MEEFTVKIICSIILLIPIIITWLMIRHDNKNSYVSGDETDWHQMCR